MDLSTALSSLVTELQYVCPVQTNPRDKPAHTAPPSILIVPERTTFKPPSTGAATVPGLAVRAQMNAAETLRVSIWAKTHDQLRDVRAAFLKACKTVLKSYELDPTGTYEEPSDVELGEIQTLRVTFLDVVEDVTLPTQAPADDTAPTIDPATVAQPTLETVDEVPQLDP